MINKALTTVIVFIMGVYSMTAAAGQKVDEYTPLDAVSLDMVPSDTVSGDIASDVAINPPLNYLSDLQNIDPLDGQSDQMEYGFDDDPDAPQPFAPYATASAYRSYLRQAQSFSFSFMRYRPRGYDNRVVEQSYTLDGVNLSDLWSIRPTWWIVGGFGSLSTAGFGGDGHGDWGLGGGYGSQIMFTAADMQVGTKVSYSFSSRTTPHKLKARYVMRELKGWNFALSGEVGAGRSLSVDGVARDGFGLFSTVSKDFAKAHCLSLSMLVSPSESQGRAASTAEAFALTGNNLYNPVWGYQGDKMRSARLSTSLAPTVILGYRWQADDCHSLTSKIRVSSSRSSFSGLTWRDAPNPWPDYYRNMPSQESSPELREELAELWRNDESVSQINFAGLYDFNRKTGSWASYIIESRVVKSDVASATIAWQGVTGKGKSAIRYNIKADYQWQRDLNFKVVDDLLGAEYWVDLDNFVEQNDDVKQLTQSNALTPNRKVRQGDEFGYKYAMEMSRTSVEASLMAPVGNFLLSGRAKIEVPTYSRKGYYHKENFSIDHSYGNSASRTFIDYSLSARGAYRRGGRAEVALTIAYHSNSPRGENLFLAPKYRSDIIADPQNQGTIAIELSGFYRVPGLRLSGAAYYTAVSNGTELRSFYDDIEHLYCHYLMRGLARSYLGVELSGEVEVVPTFWIMAMVAISSNRYVDNPMAEEFVEATGKQILSERVNLAGLHCGVSPEKVARLELSYRPRNWVFSLSGNVFGGNYVSVSPLRYTSRAAAAQQSPQDWMPQQELLAAGFTLDLFLGRTIYMRNGNRLGVYAGINNLLCNPSVVSYGYQAARIYNPTKYYYALGINGFVNISYTF